MPAAAREEVRTFAREAFADDLRRMEYIPGNYYNFHPGSHVGQGTAEGIRLISEMLNENLKKETDDYRTSGDNGGKRNRSRKDV